MDLQAAHAGVGHSGIGAADAAPLASSRHWIAAALRDGQGTRDLDGFKVDELIEIARQEGVLPALAWQLRQRPGWEELPDRLRTGLSESARTAAVVALWNRHELLRVSAVLQRHGVRALLLKGPAFGRWLYPEPYLRVSDDIDLLFESRHESDRSAHALAELGYELAFSPTDMTYEMTARATGGAGQRPELDLHCRLVNVPVYAEVFAFEGLWNASVAVPGLDGLRMIDPMNSLAHACIHRAVDLYLHRPDRLKWLYDIHLMLARMDAQAWMDFIAMAGRKRICGVCLRSIRDTVSTFATPVPAGSLQELLRLAEAEPLDWRRLHDWRYMQWQNLRALPTVGARARWLWERLIPTRSHLRELYGEGNWWRLMGRRILQGFRRLK